MCIVLCVAAFVVHVAGWGYCSLLCKLCLAGLHHVHVLVVEEEQYRYCLLLCVMSAVVCVCAMCLSSAAVCYTYVAWCLGRYVWLFVMLYVGGGLVLSVLGGLFCLWCLSTPT